MKEKLHGYQKFQTKNNKAHFQFNLLMNLIFLFPFFSTSKNYIWKLYNAYSEIHLVINEPGDQMILSNAFYKDPSDVIINGESKKNICNRVCYLEGNYNNITLVFNEDIVSCEMMFNDINNMTEIDLSKFDNSKSTNMRSMFNGCTKLEKINFGNIKTSLVKNMENLFLDWKNLTFIDVSKFDTSQVTTMEGMFSHCETIKYIDASNFKTSAVLKMNDMFAYTSKLISMFQVSKLPIA